MEERVNLPSNEHSSPEAAPALEVKVDKPFPLAQNPLNQEQVAKLEAARYPRGISQEEIDSINNARARGIHTDIV